MGDYIKLEEFEFEPWLRGGVLIGYIVHFSSRGNALTFDQLDMIARHSPVYKKLIDMHLEALGAMLDLAGEYSALHRTKGEQSPPSQHQKIDHHVKHDNQKET